MKPVRLLQRIISLILLCAGSTLAQQDTLPILTLPDLSQWEDKSFSGNTQYEVINIDNVPALKAVSKGTASGMVRHITVDLEKTPVLNWSWRVDNVLQDIDERSKAGDDYPARVYIVISGGLFFWRTRSLNYVWSSNQAKGTVWPSAYTGNVTLIAQQSGESRVGQWVNEKRNVLQDIKQHLNLDTTTIDAVAIMTDTDNSGQSATSYYRDIYFSEN